MVVNVDVGNSWNKSHSVSSLYMWTLGIELSNDVPLKKIKTPVQWLNFPLPKKKKKCQFEFLKQQIFSQHNSSFLTTTASWLSLVSWNHYTAQALGLKPKGINQWSPGFPSHPAGQTLLRWGVAKSSGEVHHCAGPWTEMTGHGEDTLPT